ncbi:patatin-like phospholipase family protein [Sulfitobacter sp.]|jgi:NTE family protein|uniref:patatin-like phospholipase family protein n=1 Tax=Sulfitobacter sp. TaxID=1903071 RepID=UPI003EF383D7
MGKYRIGLALGGGAARGLSHIGVIEELLDAGIKPDVIAGTSMGAFVGGAYAAGKLDAVGGWAKTLNMRAFMSLLDVGLTQGGVIDGQRVCDWLNELGLDQPIESLPIPYAAVATDLADGSEVWLRTGSLAAAIRASISVPGILRPVLLDQRWLVDGGLVNQIPISTCRALGADFVIAVNVTEGILGARQQKLSADAAKNAEDKRKAHIAQILGQMPTALRGAAEYIVPSLIRGGPESPAYFDVLANSLDIMQERNTQLRLAGDPPNVSIVPDVASIKLLDFDRAQEAMSAGRIAAKKAVSSIREMISR